MIVRTGHGHDDSDDDDYDDYFGGGPVDIDLAAYIYFKMYGRFPPGFQGFSRGRGGGGNPFNAGGAFYGGYDEDECLHCGNAAARDCENNCCKACCGTFGDYACKRHNVK